MSAVGVNMNSSGRLLLRTLYARYGRGANGATSDECLTYSTTSNPSGEAGGMSLSANQNVKPCFNREEGRPSYSMRPCFKQASSSASAPSTAKESSASVAAFQPPNLLLHNKTPTPSKTFIEQQQHQHRPHIGNSKGIAKDGEEQLRRKEAYNQSGVIGAEEGEEAMWEARLKSLMTKGGVRKLRVYPQHGQRWHNNHAAATIRCYSIAALQAERPSAKAT